MFLSLCILQHLSADILEYVLHHMVVMFAIFTRAKLAITRPEKQRILETQLLQDANRKPYLTRGMLPCLVTLTDL